VNKILNYDLVIIGAGFIGSMIAKKLSEYNINTAIIEKRDAPGCAVTKAGLSALHSPDFCPKGSLKEKFCINAFNKFKMLSEELGVKFKEFDEIRLAFSDEDLSRLKKYKEQGESLGLDIYEILDQEILRKEEPFITDEAIAALKIKNLGSIYPPEWCFALLETALKNGVSVYLNTEVVSIKKESSSLFQYLINTNNVTIATKTILNCAGLFANEIAAMLGDNYINIEYEKATMAILDKSASYITKNMIYGSFSFDHSQVIAPTAHGNLIIGLGYFIKTMDREDVGVARGKIDEILNMAKRLIPGIAAKDIITSFSGIKSENTLTTPKKDFYIDYSKSSPGVIHVVIGSPGLTAAPEISNYVINMIDRSCIKLIKKNEIEKKRDIFIKYAELNKEEISVQIKENPQFARIICRCEKITEAEIVEAIKRGAVTLDAIKHYTRAGMGRCQGGFCGPAILNIISRELKCPIETIVKNDKDSFLIKGHSKKKKEVLDEKY